jgi:hypothetical protein
MWEHWQQGNSYHHGAFKRLYHPAEPLFDQPVKKIILKRELFHGLNVNNPRQLQYPNNNTVKEH